MYEKDRDKKELSQAHCAIKLNDFRNHILPPLLSLLNRLLLVKSLFNVFFIKPFP